MTESTQLHAEMLYALQRLIPKTTYHDPRRLDTASLGDHWTVSEADGAPFGLGRGGPEPQPARCTPGAALLAASCIIRLFLPQTGIDR